MSLFYTNISWIVKLVLIIATLILITFNLTDDVHHGLASKIVIPNLILQKYFSYFNFLSQLSTNMNIFNSMKIVSFDYE